MIEELCDAGVGCLLDITDIAERYGVSRTTVYKYLTMFFGEDFRYKACVNGVITNGKEIIKLILNNQDMERIAKILKTAGWTEQRIIMEMVEYLEKRGYKCEKKWGKPRSSLPY